MLTILWGIALSLETNELLWQSRTSRFCNYRCNSLRLSKSRQRLLATNFGKRCGSGTDATKEKGIMFNGFEEMLNCEKAVEEWNRTEKLERCGIENVRRQRREGQQLSKRSGSWKAGREVRKLKGWGSSCVGVNFGGGSKMCGNWRVHILLMCACIELQLEMVFSFRPQWGKREAKQNPKMHWENRNILVMCWIWQQSWDQSWLRSVEV